MTSTKIALLSAASLLAVAAHAQAAAPSPAPAAAVVVTVFGQRAAEREALDQQHKSQTLKEVVTANDAGKLPDQNVGEAVQRMPGVTVDDDQGEGRYVVIRGLDPALAAVRINGQDAAAPETDTREVKVDTIPSGLIGSIEVLKDQTAEYDANAIAGAVNVRTMTAFDKKKPFVTARYAAGHIDLDDKTSYDTDLSAGTRFGDHKQFGVVVALNASRRPQASDNLQGSESWGEDKTGAQIVPSDWKLRDYYVIRNRQGAVVNFDYKPNDDVHLYAHTLFSHFTDMEQRQQFGIKLAGQTATGADTGTFASAKAAKRDAKYRFEDEHISTVSFGGEVTVGQGKLDADITNSTAIKDDDPRYNFSYVSGKKDAKGTYDLSDVLFDVDPGGKVYDASDFTASEAELEADHYREMLNQASVNYSLPTSLWGGDTTFRFGAKYSKRHKRSDVNYKLYDVSHSGMTLSDYQSYTGATLYDGRYDFGPTVDFIKSLDAAEAAGYLTDANLEEPDTLVGELADDYDVTETVSAGYAQATIRSGNWTVTPGLRVEHTANTSKAKAFDEDSSIDMPFNSFGKKDYTDLFPSVVGRYDVNADTLVRFAATTSIGRPNYVDLAPHVNISKDEGSAEMGNPDLNPLKSLNLDAGFEHYFGKRGVISVSAFYKDIQDPIFNTGYTGDLTIGGVTYTDLNVSQPKNLDKATLAGVEFNLVYQFDEMLPAPLDGLGATLNLTSQKSSTDGAPGRADKVSLIYTSDLTGTAELTYEKYNWTARIAYSYRSKFLDTLGADKSTDIYTAARGRVDVKIGYAINHNWQLFVQGKNLNDAPWRRFIGNARQLVENEAYGQTWAVGVAAKF
jgi:TonB-dependent receptor